MLSWTLLQQETCELVFDDLTKTSFWSHLSRGVADCFFTSGDHIRDRKALNMVETNIHGPYMVEVYWMCNISLQNSVYLLPIQSRAALVCQDGV